MPVNTGCALFQVPSSALFNLNKINGLRGLSVNKKTKVPNDVPKIVKNIIKSRKESILHYVSLILKYGGKMTLSCRFTVFFLCKNLGKEKERWLYVAL